MGARSARRPIAARASGPAMFKLEVVGSLVVGRASHTRDLGVPRLPRRTLHGGAIPAETPRRDSAPSRARQMSWRSPSRRPVVQEGECIVFQDAGSFQMSPQLGEGAVQPTVERLLW